MLAITPTYSLAAAAPRRGDVEGAPVIAVIGCGNIGSRHLQGLARLSSPATVHAADPAADSRIAAAARVAEIDNAESPSFAFHDCIDRLPAVIDLAIIATGAAPRRALLEQLLSRRRVGALILEKFLFCRHADYEAVERLLADTHTPAWVNTPRRAWPSYRQLATELRMQGPLTIAVELGRANGVASNAIHFIDLAAFLIGDEHPLEVDGKRLRGQTNVSRHAGTMEFFGVMTAMSSRGDVLTIRGRDDSTAPHTVTIQSRDRSLTIDERNQWAVMSRPGAPKGIESAAFPIVMQSFLTGEFAQHVLQGQTPMLPTYAESARLHRQCLSAFLEGLGYDRGADVAVSIT